VSGLKGSQYLVVRVGHTVAACQELALQFGGQPGGSGCASQQRAHLVLLLPREPHATDQVVEERVCRAGERDVDGVAAGAGLVVAVGDAEKEQATCRGLHADLDRSAAEHVDGELTVGRDRCRAVRAADRQ